MVVVRRPDGDGRHGLETFLAGRQVGTGRPEVDLRRGWSARGARKRKNGWRLVGVFAGLETNSGPGANGQLRSQGQVPFKPDFVIAIFFIKYAKKKKCSLSKMAEIAKMNKFLGGVNISILQSLF